MEYDHSPELRRRNNAHLWSIDDFQGYSYTNNARYINKLSPIYHSVHYHSAPPRKNTHRVAVPALRPPMVASSTSYRGTASALDPRHPQSPGTGTRIACYRRCRGLIGAVANGGVKGICQGRWPMQRCRWIRVPKSGDLRGSLCISFPNLFFCFSFMQEMGQRTVYTFSSTFPGTGRYLSIS